MAEAADKVIPDSQTQHVEYDGDLKSPHNVVLKSSLDDLGLWPTVKRFKKVTIVFPNVGMD